MAKTLKPKAPNTAEIEKPQKPLNERTSLQANIGEKPKCGVVIPISSIDGCSEAHWTEVRGILSDAISDADFIPNLVSNSDDVGVIQKRIVQNLYDNPVVVCDVSAKNANVMFELGLRLAFDKPTIIVIDDKTNYSFDTSPIEHIKYPRDLRYNKIIDFKAELTDKIQATHEKAQNDPSFSTFLKHFGKFKVAGLATEEIGKDDFVLNELKNIKLELNQIGKRNPTAYDYRSYIQKGKSPDIGYDISLFFKSKPGKTTDDAIKFLNSIIPYHRIRLNRSMHGEFSFMLNFHLDEPEVSEILAVIERRSEDYFDKHEITVQMA